MLVASARASSDGQNRSLVLKSQGDLLGSGSTVVSAFSVDLSSANGRIGQQDGSALAVRTFNIGSGVQQRGIVSAKARATSPWSCGGDISHRRHRGGPMATRDAQEIGSLRRP